MKISYAICVCTEYREIDTLLTFLEEVKDAEDEIVILVDNTKASKELTMVLAHYTGLRIFSRAFANDFSHHKNYLNSKCTGEYIFNIDADEIPTEHFIKNLKETIAKDRADLYFVPRINICLGQTDAFLKRHSFSTNEIGWVNWPDHQGRVYRNHKDIYWTSEVHETIGGPGCKNKNGYDPVPRNALLHVKTVKVQDRQNELYDTIIKS